MGGGNGAKAAQKRERAMKDAQGGGAKSQLKVNVSAMNKKCSVCMQPFLQTTNKKVGTSSVGQDSDEHG